MTNSYPGGKGGAGIWQRIISRIPPHETLIIPFAGHCSVSRNIRPCGRLILCDADSSVCSWWSRRLPPHAEIHHCDGIEFLRHYFALTQFPAAAVDVGIGDESSCGSAAAGNGADGSRLGGLAAELAAANGGGRSSTPTPEPAASDRSPVAVYCDPTYPRATLQSAPRYREFMTDADHARLLEVATQIPAARASILISCYRCPQYDDALSDWTREDYLAMTRGGYQRTESLWRNFPAVTELHDYRWIGGDKRGREKLRRRRHSILGKLRRMKPAERQQILVAIAAEFGAPAEPPVAATFLPDSDF